MVSFPPVQDMFVTLFNGINGLHSVDRLIIPFMVIILDKPPGFPSSSYGK